MKKEIYVSFDVETDGPIPGANSMLSLGAMAFTLEGLERDEYQTFYVNILPLPDARPDPKTLIWWGSNAYAYEQTKVDQRDPRAAMEMFCSWLSQFPSPVAAAYPAGFDFSFLYWYLVKFTGGSPFGFSCLDMKTLGMSILGTPFKKTVKSKMPKHWFSHEFEHTHNAREDAMEQGFLFFNMMKALNAKGSEK